MAKPFSDKVKKGRRGRPVTTGRTTLIGVRMADQPLKAIDAWASAQDDRPLRPEAIRRLVEIGLKAKVK